MKDAIKKMIFLIASFTLLMQDAHCQKQANYWYFADSAGMHFVNGEPELLSDGGIGESFCMEGSSAISDSTGQLLFYCCAKKIFNRLHQVMPHGDNLLGGGSSTQGALIVPMPGSDERFYVFTLDEFQNNLANGLNYYIVNMCLEDGYGDVETTPNFAGGGGSGTLLLSDAGEKQAATYHANGADIWLIVRRHLSNQFYAYLITADGIENPVISSIGWDSSDYSEISLQYACAIGQIKFSPDGSMLAMGIGNNSPNRLQLFDFNNSTGIVSNEKTLYINTSQFPYGVSFSPDNSKLYARGLPPTGLRQYDVTLNTEAEIIASAIDVPWIGGYGATGMQLANNGKIYVSFNDRIGVINQPNESGAACNYVGDAIDLYGGIGTLSVYTLPGFIDGFNYHNGIPECFPDGLDELSKDKFLVVSPNPCDNSLLIASSHDNLSFTSLKLLSTSGQTMAQMESAPITTKRYYLNVSQVPEGIYILEVSSSIGKIYRKIVVDN